MKDEKRKDLTMKLVDAIINDPSLAAYEDLKRLDIEAPHIDTMFINDFNELLDLDINEDVFRLIYEVGYKEGVQTASVKILSMLGDTTTELYS